MKKTVLLVFIVAIILLIIVAFYLSIPKHSSVSNVTHIDWISNESLMLLTQATSSDGLYAITVRNVPEENPSPFFTPTDLIVTDRQGTEHVYKNPKSIYPFLWVGNNVYGVAPSYESASDVLSMTMLGGNTPGPINRLGFTSSGLLDVTRQYYAFTNGKQGEDPKKDVLFCATGDIEPSYQLSDEVGYFDFLNGTTTILVGDMSKIYKVQAWSSDSKRILYLAFDKPKPSNIDQVYFCPSPDAGISYSIDIATKEIRKETSPDILHLQY